MSRFLKNHPKLAIFFNGAVKQMTSHNYRNLCGWGAVGIIAEGTTVGIAGIAGSGAASAIGALVLPALPIAAGVAVVCIAADSVCAGIKALKAADDRPFLEKHPKLAIAFNMASLAREELKNTKESLKKRLLQRHTKMRA